MGMETTVIPSTSVDDTTLEVGSNGTQFKETEVAYDIENGNYTQLSVDISSQTTVPTSVFCENSKLYVMGSNRTVYQYAMTDAEDISTASYESKSFTMTQIVGATEARGFDLCNSGTKAYGCGDSTGIIYQYTLSTAYDISTASYDTKSFDPTTQEGTPEDFIIRNSGTKLYLVGRTNDTVYQYTLSTAYDISTASYDTKSFSVASQATNPKGIEMNSDGTKMFICDGAGNVYQYTLSTAYDVSTASYDSISMSLSDTDALPQDFRMFSSGKYGLNCGNGNDRIYQYVTENVYVTSNVTGKVYKATGQ